MISCPACGKSLPVIYAGNVQCVCEHRFVAEGDGLASQPVSDRHLSSNRQLPCIHLGTQVGTADCDCATKPRVYACQLHGLCLPRMRVTAAAVVMDDGSRATVSRSCSRCGDHSPA